MHDDEARSVLKKLIAIARIKLHSTASLSIFIDVFGQHKSRRVTALTSDELGSSLHFRRVYKLTLDNTRKAKRAGKLALMVPVIIFTDGRWVAITKCMPTARASCARRAIGVSTSLPAVIIKSANSSTTRTI